MQNDNEPKQDVKETAEALYDKLTTPGEQQEESSPQTEQSEPKPEGGSDPLKTQSTAKETDEGFNSHPKWIEREGKLKEARTNLEARDKELERYSKLLDDPDVYAKWLKNQGYSDAHIKEMLREKGFESPKSEEKPGQAQAIAERACAKLGWDITRLNQDQKAYIQDSVNLTMAIIQESVGPMLDQRLGPMEQVSSEWAQQKQFSSDEMEVQKLAKQEFPDADWESVIKPAISKFLAELDEKDPKRTIKLSYIDIYNGATRPLLRELNESKGRQDVRDANKKNLRPLGTGTATKTGEPVQKGKSAREEAESFLEARGIR